MSEQPIIRVECVDSAGNNTSALELSRVAYWPNDPVRWSSVWLVESDSPRGRTVMTDDQLRQFANACLVALDESNRRTILPPLANDVQVLETRPHDAETLRYRADLNLVTDSKVGTALIEGRIDALDQWTLFGPGIDDPFDGEVIAEGTCIDLSDGVDQALTAFRGWQP